VPLVDKRCQLGIVTWIQPAGGCNTNSLEFCGLGDEGVIDDLLHLDSEIS